MKTNTPATRQHLNIKKSAKVGLFVFNNVKVELLEALEA